MVPPAAGALLQEGIDVAVILNALRALRGNPAVEVELPADTEEMLRRFASEHDELRDTIGSLRDAADRLAAGADPAALESLTRAYAFLTERILPHERAEETQLYPALARPLGSGEATATMSRTHAEIQRLSDRIGTHVALAQASNGIQPDQVDDLLACLYGLYTLLQTALPPGGGELLHAHRGRSSGPGKTPPPSPPDARGSRARRVRPRQ